MPRDGELPRAPLRPGLAGLAQLRDELRKPMPEGFEWDYTKVAHSTKCGTAGCAIGLAVTIWPEEAPRFLEIYNSYTLYNCEGVSARFGISTDEAHRLFSGEGLGGVRADVTETMVADEIDKLLIEKGYVEEQVAG